MKFHNFLKIAFNENSINSHVWKGLGDVISVTNNGCRVRPIDGVTARQWKRTIPLPGPFLGREVKTWAIEIGSRRLGVTFLHAILYWHDNDWTWMPYMKFECRNSGPDRLLFFCFVLSMCAIRASTLPYLSNNSTTFKPNLNLRRAIVATADSTSLRQLVVQMINFHAHIACSNSNDLFV